MNQIVDKTIDEFLKFVIEIMPPVVANKLGITDRVEKANAVNKVGTESGQYGRFNQVREYSSVDMGRRAQAAIYQSIWLRKLAYRMVPGYEEAAPNPEDFLGEEVEEITRTLMTLLFATLKGLVLEFNELVSDVPSLAALRMSVTEVSEVKEDFSNLSEQARAENKLIRSGKKSVTYLRCRAASSTWSLSMRGSQGRIEFFLVPVLEIFKFSQSETPARLKSVLQMDDSHEGIWNIDRLPADPDELYYLLRGLFKTLVFASAQGLKEDLVGSSILENLEGAALRSTVRELLLAEQNMAQKIVSQQEEIQNRIARDLHDAVIADIMTLKRQMTSERRISDADLIKGMDDVSQKLREICQDLAPRDLIDWGLKTVIADLLERVEQRTGADCSFECEGDIPELPNPVQLHIYRIVQESLTNVEKYAEASRIMVNIEVSENIAKFIIRDNGKGVDTSESDPRKAREGGTGQSGNKERAEMIRCYFPARLKFESEPGKGTMTTLEVRYNDSI
ncbi:MAG TPA: ATP-binding protein [Drouetiella sp.]